MKGDFYNPCKEEEKIHIGLKLKKKMPFRKGLEKCFLRGARRVERHVVQHVQQKCGEKKKYFQKTSFQPLWVLPIPYPHYSLYYFPFLAHYEISRQSHFFSLKKYNNYLSLSSNKICPTKCLNFYPKKYIQIIFFPHILEKTQSTVASFFHKFNFIICKSRKLLKLHFDFVEKNCFS